MGLSRETNFSSMAASAVASKALGVSRWRVAFMCGVLSLVASVSGCARPHGATTLSVKQVAVRTKPGIVRVEAGGDRVGSGFVVDARGLIVTNLHVVAGTAEIKIRMASGQELRVVQIAAVDPQRDLVLLRVSPPDEIPALRLGDSSKVEAGDPVISIGNPLGVFDYTISDGLISSVRVLSPQLTVLQISAPISQGSSGGPIFNSYGEVIGISTAIVNGGQNINFALPSNYVRPLLEEKRGMTLAAFAHVSRRSEVKDRTELATAKVVRAIPRVEAEVFAGCSARDVEQLKVSLLGSIASGSPLYNDGNHEACYRIYEGTALLAERALPCEGARDVLTRGLARAATLDSFAAKAWALRDTIDGMLAALERLAPSGV
ncbi:MAG: trypsin-like peptidase domain-containing protein [Myxococcales bacterium]|nr:trypsin-like peptidase domain-containing protein [Myxococcales bacterium]